MPPLVRLVALLIPGRDSRIAWQECRNKIQIMSLVQEVSSILPPPGTDARLGDLVDRCYAMAPFPALWAVEGLGHWLGERAFESSQEPDGLLTGDEARELPSGSLTMLHAGIGLAFAKHSLEKLKAKSPETAVEAAVSRFVELCRKSSRPGYTGAAVESLGLVTRFVHGAGMVRRVEQALLKVAPELVGYLWHGAGRASYFHPLNFIPGVRSPWRAVALIRKEATTPLAHSNLVAGFSWALNLVNMQHLEVIRDFLHHHGDAMSRSDAFTDGIMASVIMRFDTTPDDPNLQTLLVEPPARPTDPAERLWTELVTGPARRAVQEIYPRLAAQNRLEEVFHYQGLAAGAG